MTVSPLERFQYSECLFYWAPYCVIIDLYAAYDALRVDDEKSS